MKTAITEKLISQELLSKPPEFLRSGSVQYETIVGSMSYGVSTDSSDMDILGFCIPDKNTLFPHTVGYVQGFGHQPELFEQFQQHKVRSLDGQTEYDLTVYNITKFMNLCMENNPNMVDSLFTPDRCVTFITPIGKMIRDNRELFLHKGCWSKFKGYAYSQLGKLGSHAQKSNPKRAASIAAHGYDVKFGYHVVRLLNEVEQILLEGTLDLERSSAQLRSIREGEWSLEQIQQYFAAKALVLEEAYARSSLRQTPDHDAIKGLLLQALEEHFGSIDQLINREDRAPMLLKDLEALMQRYK